MDNSVYKNNNLDAIFVAGEHCEVDTLRFCKKVFGVDNVHDHWWQSESGFPITAAMKVPNQPEGTSGLPVPGWDLKILDADSKTEVSKPGVLGSVVVKKPLPPGALSGLWRNEELYHEYYLAGFE